jgi:hypothetical protein
MFGRSEDPVGMIDTDDIIVGGVKDEERLSQPGNPVDQTLP